MSAHALEKTLVRRMAGCSALRGAVRGWLVGALASGSLLLLLRHGLRLTTDGWPLLLALPPLLAALCGLHAWRRQRLSLGGAAALLDARGGCGGLLVSADLPGWDAWQPACPIPAAVTVRWHEPRLWRMAALASLFAAMAAVWPQRPPGSGPTRRMQLDADIDQLLHQVELLADSLLDEETAEAMAEQLEALRETARSDAPGEAWESLDLLAGRLQKEAAEAAEAALNAMAQLEPLAALAEALRDALADTPHSEELARTLEQLAAALDAAARQAEGLPADALAEALRNALADGAFDAAALEALAAQWKDGMELQQGVLSEWSEARLIDPSMLKRCENGKGCDEAAAALAACLAGGADGEGPPGGEALGEMIGELFGISRGPGPAPLILGDPVELAGTDGVALHPASRPSVSPDEMQPRGVSLAAPEADPLAPTAAGRLQGTAAGGGAAHRQALLPRHRRVAAAYFGGATD